MKKYISIMLLFSMLSASYGQQLDSIKYNYGHLYYHSYGKGEPIVMLSGGPGNSGMQLESVALKLAATHRVILLEQRGTGLSIPTPLDSTTVNLKEAISDINLLLTHLKIKKTILFGHSWGGNLGLIYASQFPQKVKSLILLAPGFIGLGWENYRLFIDNLITRLSNEEKEQIYSLTKKTQSNSITESEKKDYARLKRLPYVFDKSKIDSLMPLMEGHHNEKTFNLMLMNAMKYDFNLKTELKKIKCPIDLICGQQDALNNIAYELKIARSDIALHWIEKSGHFPMHEQPKEFYAVMDKILEKAKNFR